MSLEGTEESDIGEPNQCRPCLNCSLKSENDEIGSDLSIGFDAGPT